MKRILLAAVAAVLAAACSLQEDPGYFVDREGFYENYSQCRAAINGLYVGLKNCYTFRMLTLTDAHSDLLFEPAPTVAEARLDLTPTLPGEAGTFWKQGYLMVMYANAAIAGIGRAPVTEAQRAALMSEAVTLRAFWYWFLTSFFGDVPFYTEDVTDSRVMERIAHLPRMSAVETRRYLIDELNTWFSYDENQEYTGALPAVRTSENEGNRAGWALAEMLVMKMAMWNAYTDPDGDTDWDQVALTAFHRLYGVYGDLTESDYPLDDILFRCKNTPESIFEVQHTYSTDGISYVSNLACVCMPWKTVDAATHTAWYDGIAIDELGYDAIVWTPVRPNLYFSAGLQPRGAGDRRAEINMAWSYGGVEFSNVNIRPWMGPKFWCPGMFNSYDSNNYKIFRYADAVLLAAEACCRKGERTEAVRYLDQVRNRAGLGGYTFKGDAKLFSEIQDERARELVGEFTRKFDLVRWGIWYERVTAFNDYAELQDGVKPCHEYLPIPDKQVKYSGYALDNKAYNSYGL